MQKKYNMFKKLKVKIINKEKRKKNGRRKKKGKFYRTVKVQHRC